MATKNPVTKLTSAFDLFSKSKELVLQNLSVFGILYIIPFLSTLSSMGAQRRLENGEARNATTMFEQFSTAGAIGVIGFGALIAAVSFVLCIIVQIMLVAAETAVSKGEKPNLSQLWDTTRRVGLRMLGFAVVFTLLFVGGLFLLIIPGLIVLRRYFLTPYYIIDQDLSISEAMKQSAADSKPVSKDVWTIIGMFILLSVPGIIPFIGPLISLTLTALYSVAPALRYREIKNTVKLSAQN